MIRFAFVIGLMTSPAQACDSYVAHVASFHTDRSLIENVTEVNPGLGCRLGLVEVGAFENSYGDVSAYALMDSSHDGFAIFGGVATGYHKDLSAPDSGIVPLAGVAYHTSHHTTRVGPSLSSVTGNVGMVVSYSFTFGGSA